MPIYKAVFKIGQKLTQLNTYLLGENTKYTFIHIRSFRGEQGTTYNDF